MSTLQNVQATTVLRKSITIPATGGTADTLANLASLTADEKSRCIGCKVHKKDTAGSDRAAFIAGDAVGTLTEHVGSGEAYTNPASRDATTTYVKSAAGAISNTLVIFYMVPVG